MQRLKKEAVLFTLLLSSLYRSSVYCTGALLCTQPHPPTTANFSVRLDVTFLRGLVGICFRVQRQCAGPQWYSSAQAGCRKGLNGRAVLRQAAGRAAMV